MKVLISSLFKGTLLSVISLVFVLSTSTKAQSDLKINVKVPLVGENRFSICGGQKIVEIRIENITPGIGLTLSNIIDSVGLASVPGFHFNGFLNHIGGVAVSVLDPSIPSFTIGNMAKGDTVLFQIGVEVDCGALSKVQAGTAFNFSNYVIFNEPGPIRKTESRATGNFEVVKPALSIPAILGNSVPGLTKTGSFASVFDASKGNTDTIKTIVVNAGDGPLTSFVYWVKDHPLLTNTGVRIGSYFLPVIATVGDTTFYQVDFQAIKKAMPGPNPNDSAKFQFNEVLMFKEIWRVDDCAASFPDIIRGIRYGCDGTTLARCEQSVRTSGLRFGFLRPVLNVNSTWGLLTYNEVKEGVPSCYKANKPKQRFIIYNTGTAYADSINFSLTAYRADLNVRLDTASVKISIGKYGAQTHISPVKTYLVAQSTICPISTQQIRSADYRLNEFQLKPGDTLWVEFQMEYINCGCNKDPGFCEMQNWYYSLLNWGDRSWAAQASYSDPCHLNNYLMAQVHSTDYGAIQSMFVEGPIQLNGGQSGTQTYTANAANNSFIPNRTYFPNGIFRVEYIIDKGLDWKGTSGDLATNELKFYGRNGVVWDPSRIQYVDNNSSGPDTLFVDYEFGNFPPTFSYIGGIQYKLNVIADCSETGPACLQGGNAHTRMHAYFSPDKNCTDCDKGQLVTCFTDLDTEIKCPSCTPCEGLVPISFNIDRLTTEQADNDNNSKPDATGSINKNLIAIDRFISGDTLKATYRGRFVTSVTHPTWQAAWSVMDLPAGFAATLTPLGGSAKILKASGAVYDADLLQQFPNGTQVVTNLHPGNLNYLGNNVPANLVYENNDTIELTVLFTVADPTFNLYTDGNYLKPLVINDNSFATNDTLWDVPTPDRYACDNIRDRVYYIEMRHYLSSANGSNFGGCTLGFNGYDWTGFFIGSENLDYFPFEFRKPKAYLITHKTYIAPGFEYDRYRWHFFAKDFIGRPDPVGIAPLNSGTYNDLDVPQASGNYYFGDLPLTSPYLTIDGDTIYFRVLDFVRDNFGELIADEGFRFTGYPRFRGTCNTPITPIYGFIQKPVYEFSMDSKVFGYDYLRSGRVARSPSEAFDNINGLYYGYIGAPKLSIQAPLKTQQLIGEEVCFEVQLINSSDYASTLTWLTVQNQSGSILIKSVRDITNPAVPITYSPVLGIYQIGQMNSAVSGNPFIRSFEICVTGNSCNLDSFVVNTGWECKNYPYSLQEAKCLNPQTLLVEPIDAELGMIIKSPEDPVTADLCSEQPYVIQLSSTVLGTLNNINLEFEIPYGQEYIPGSFEIAYLPPTSGNYLDAVWEPADDPVNNFGNTWHINVSDQDTILKTEGLPGTLQIGKNYTFVRFKTFTTCNYASGSSVKFLSWAYNACGELTNYKYSPASPLKINGLPEIYKTEVQLNADTLNPCNMDQADINVSFAVSPGSVSTASKDSILIKLPPGVHYIAGSFMNIMNAQNIPPVVQNINGQEILIWDVQDGLGAGAQVKFKFSIVAQNAQQACRAYPISAFTFSSKETTCLSTGTNCAIRAISDETEEFITFVKPNVAVSNFHSTSRAILPNMEELCYEVTLSNSGEDAPVGTPIKVEVYAEDGDGDLGRGDVLLFTRTFITSLAKGESKVLMACDTVMAGTTCRLMAVLNPATSCVCEVKTSFLSYPGLTQQLTTDFEACSNELITGIGPNPLTKGMDYKWLSLDGSNIAYLTNIDTTKTNFKARNTTPGNLQLSYLLRTTRNGQCTEYDTVNITVFPEHRDSISFNTCLGASFNLAGPTGGSNYQWSPTTGLTNPNSPTTEAAGLLSPRNYRLDYLDANGCPAFYIAKVSLIDCGNTALGDTVWIDYNYDGIQNNNEPGLANVQVQLFYANNLSTPISTQFTDANGHYLFDTIPAADYVIKFILPNGATFTKSNIGNDSKDSDVNPVTGLTPSYFVPNGVQNLDFDAGVVFFDWSDAPNTYKTNLASGGAQHVIIPNLYLGNSVDAEANGIPASTGNPANGDDNLMTISGINDEDGLTIKPALGTGIIGRTYTLTIKATNLTALPAYLTGWIDFNRNGTFSAIEGQQIPIPSGTNNGTFTLNYTVPANLSIGMSYIRLRLTQDASVTTNTPGGLVLSGEVEDYEIMITNQLFDLALTKMIDAVATPGPYGPGASVNFKIKIINQGNVDATNVNVVDSLPSGLILNDANWTLAGNKATLVNPLALITAGKDTTINIICQISPSFKGTTLINFAEINSASNSIGFPDVDSRPDNILSNDVGGQVGTNTDDHVSDNGLDSDGNGIRDEDDQDPAFVPIIDMALKKVVATPAPYTYNQLIDFKIWIYNQGTVRMQNTKVNDYIPNGYTYTAADNIGWTGVAPIVNYTYAPVILPGDSAMITLKLRIARGSGTNNWTNYAEITEIRDTSNTIVNSKDFDSNPNSNGAGETSVTPGSTNDDNITSTNKGGDEDDHDPAGIEIFDLAMKKLVISPSPYPYGSTITYRHWIYNQGNVVARNIAILDSIPCGLKYLTGNAPLWSYNPVTHKATTTFVGPLNPGDSTPIDITLEIQSCLTAGSFTNISEISSATDGSGGSRTDMDSQPDSNQGNDGIPINNAINDPLDEDDHDPETIEIWDLALRKKLITAGAIKYGDLITYRITIFNQGSAPAQNIQVADYIPSGYNYSASDNIGWTGASPTVYFTITGPIAPGDSSFVDIKLKLKATSGGSSNWTNYSEINSSQDTKGIIRTNDDADSRAGSNNATERGVTPGSANDDNISSSNIGGEEDDHDPAGVPIFDLALNKKIINPKAIWKYGDTVCFEIKVFNQGNITASDVTITDYVSCGYEFLSLNEPAWIYSPGSRIAQMTLPGNILPGDSTSYQIKLKVNPCSTPNAYVNKSEIFRAEDGAGNNMTNNDIDSKADNNPNNDAGGMIGTNTDDHINDDGRDTNADGITDEDDEDPSAILLIDMALKKTIATAGPYTYGQALTFNIRIFNQGSVPMQNTKVTDYIPSGFTFNAAANPAWTGVAPTVMTTYGPIINPGDSALVTLILTVARSSGINAWVNYAQISEIRDNTNTIVNTKDADSNPNSNFPGETSVTPGSINDDNITSNNIGGEEDDHDPAGFQVFDLAMKKVKSNPGPYNYGDIITYTHWIYNQGSIAASNIQITDSIPCGLNYLAVNTPTWTYNPGTREAVTTYTGTLLPSDSVAITIQLQLQPCSGIGSFVNISEISSATDNTGAPVTDMDSTPDGNQNNDGIPVDNATNNPADQDDHDPEALDIWDLAMKKELITAGPYTYGQTLNFRIKVFNQGASAAYNVSIADYIPSGFQFFAASNPSWTGAAPTINAVIPGPINPGDSSIVNLSLVIQNTTGGTSNWINYAEITASKDAKGIDKTNSDIDSRAGSNGPAETAVTPGSVNDNNITSTNKGGEEDDHDPAGIQIFDLALRKQVGSVLVGNYQNGDQIHYQITVFNQGSIPAHDVVVIDRYPCGLNFVNSAATNPGWSNPSLGIAEKTLATPLMPGQSAILDIYFTIDVPAIDCPAGVNGYKNIAEIKSANDPSGNPGQDIDSNPNSNTTPENAVEPNQPGDDVVDVSDPLGNQDDHDPADLKVFDLALMKKLDPTFKNAPFKYGDKVKFNIYIINQGNICADEVTVTEYIPDGYKFNAADNPAWNLNGTNAELIFDDRILCWRDTAIVSIILEIKYSSDEKAYLNYAEIKSAIDENNLTRNEDNDSNFNDDPDDDTGGVPNTSDDDNVSGDGTNKKEDEDDHDPALIEIIDLALRKTVVQAGPYRKDDILDYKIEVFNQGNITVQDVAIIDNIPCGLIFDPSSNPDWTLSGTNVTRVLAGPILPHQSATVILKLKVTACNKTGAYLNFAEITSVKDDKGKDRSSDDADSSPDDDPDNDGDPIDDAIEDPYDEDDHDLNLIEVWDIALKKVVIDPTRIYLPDEIVDFRITVYNQGNMDAYNVTIKDFIPAGYDYDITNDTRIPAWSLTDTIATAIIPGPIEPQDSTEVTISLIIRKGFKYPSRYINSAEVSSFTNGDYSPRVDLDSDPDADPTNDGDPIDDAVDNPDDEDDSDPALPIFQIYDLALRKIPSTNYARIGDLTEFKIKVYNQGLNATVTNVTVVDYIPSGLEFVAAANPTWTLIGSNAETTLAGPLEDGDSITVSIFLRVKPNAKPSTIINYTEIKYFEDEDGVDVTDREYDSTPDGDPNNDIGGDPGTPQDDKITDDGTVDEDDHDGAVPLVFDLALIKRTNRTLPVRVGDDIPFTLTIFNQGNVAAHNILVNEYIPAGYILSPADANAWTSVSLSLATKTISSTLNPGDSTNIQIVLRVVPGANRTNLNNVAEIGSAQDPNGNTPPDMDSDPDDDPDNDGDSIDDEKDSCCGIDEDDTDGAEPPIMDLALRKTTERKTPVREGDVVKFKIEIFNQGNIPTDNMIMVDAMESGFLFESINNPDWNYNGIYATYNMNRIIQPGEKDSACIFLTILPTATTLTLINRAEIIHMEDGSGFDMTNYDIDSDPDADPDNDAGGNPFGDTDDVIDGDGSGQPGDDDIAGDEDDEDATHLIMCGAIACKGNINFSLDKDCAGILTPGALLSPVSNPIDVYVITIKDKWGVPHANSFDGSDIGKCFNVTITDTLCAGNSCWSTVCIEDKFAPVIACVSDTFSCAEFAHGGSDPIVTENCGDYELILLDEKVQALSCDPLFVKQVTRTWTSKDNSGNQGDTCTQVILVERPNISLVAFPHDTTFDCSVTYLKDVNGYPHPLAIGVPTLDGDTIWPTTNFLCNFVVDYEDIDLGETACKRKILRTWRVREWWCNGEVVRTMPQWITMIDTTGPVITKHAYDMHASTSNRSCEATVILPSIEAADACHSVVRIDVEYPGGILRNQNGGKVSLPVGIDTIIYRVFDNCYNVTSDTITVTVRDNTEPVAICDRRTIVALNHSGFNWVPAEVFDDGSFDECHLHHFEVRRMDDNSCGTTGSDDWGPEVGFCCEDVGHEIMVGFKVIDASGNEAICMVLTEVQDKEAPLVTCPPNITVDCRFPIDLKRLSLSFGKIASSKADQNAIVIDTNYYHKFDGHPIDGLAQDNCPPIIREEVDSSEFDKCGHGIIKRRFIVSDLQGNSSECTQLITVDNFANPFNDDDIVWPLDIDTSGICDPRLLIPELLKNPLTKQPRFTDDVCSKIGVSYTDHTFSPNIPADACHKIFRVWKIIDWCQVNSGEFMIFTDTQIIKITNQVDPIILAGCRDTIACSYDVNCGEVPMRFLIKAEDDCTAPDQMLYKFKMDYNSDGTIDYVTQGIAGYMVNKTWPVGKHRVTWEVEDLCGNTSKCSFTADLRNCKPPIAYCNYGIAIGLVPTDLNGNGKFDPYPTDNEIDTVWAKDIDAGSYHACGYPVRLSFSKDTNDRFRVFTCDHANTRQDVELWVTDINGNQSFCKTYILVQDNNNVNICPSKLTATVSGIISREDAALVENVNITMDVNKAEIAKSDFDGKYQFISTQVGSNYDIKPEKNDDWLNGVTTADIVKIQKHILGTDEITSPYKIIAADVNKSGTITARDISDLRKLILGVTSDIPNNTSWRFVDANYTFRDAESALTDVYPESYKIAPLLADMRVNFTGIKIGDLNASAKTRGANKIVTRSGAGLVLTTDEKQISANEIYAVDFSSDNIESYNGFQMTLKLNAEALEIQDIIANPEINMAKENFHVIRKNAGLITFSWDGLAKNQSKLFTIIFKAKQNNNLSKLIQINSDITPALSIPSSGADEENVSIKFNNANNEVREFVVLQNEPNPWTHETHIGILLPQNGDATLTVYDAMGKVYLQEDKSLKKGYNDWKLNQQLLPKSGVYFYQVDYAGQTLTKKMIFIE